MRSDNRRGPIGPSAVAPRAASLPASRRLLPAPTVGPADLVRCTLESGLRLVIHENHLAPVVALQAWVDVGAADEVGPEAGIAHVFEHMLFKGTNRRGVGEIAKAVEAAGGDINAWTSHDQTVYHLVLASRFFDAGLDVLADALRFSSFDPEELARELKVVLEEVKQGEDSPQRVVTQALFRKAYGAHPYGRPVIGSARSVRRFRRDALLDFFRRWYTPANMTLVIAGDVDAEVAIARSAELFAFDRPPPRKPRRKSLPAPPQRAPRVLVASQDLHESHLALAFPVPGLKHEDTGALDVAAIVLGQGESSRLNLRVKRNQLVTDCLAYTHSPRGPGLLVVSAAVQEGGIEAATRALACETLRLAQEEVTGEEIAKAQAIIESDGVYQKETVQGMARKLGFFETVADGVEYEEEYNRQVARVTPESLRQVAARYLRLDQITLSVLVPEREHSPALGDKLLGAIRRGADDLARRRSTRPSSPAVDRDEVVVHTLDSGLRLLVRRDASVPLVALRAVWPGGLRYEEPRTNGINNLLASLVTRGTSRRNAEEIAQEVEGMAGSLAGFSGRNSFGLRGELLARHFERGLATFAECVLDPTLSRDELDKERSQVLEELRAQEDSLTQVAFRLFWNGLYRKAPYRLDLMGTPSSLRGLTADRLAGYYRRHYAPAGMVLALVGDVDPGRVIERCDQLFGHARDLPVGPPAPDPDPPRGGGPRVLRETRERQQTHFLLGYPGTTLADPDRFALEVLSTILSGQGGRLFVELRDKQGLAYRLNAYSLEGLDPGYFAVYMACSPANLAASRRGVVAELARLKEELVTEEELGRVQRYLVGSHEIGLQRRTALAASLAFNECYGIGYDEHLRYAPAILGVTADAVRRVARRFFDRDREVVAIVGPASSDRS